MDRLEAYPTNCMFLLLFVVAASPADDAFAPAARVLSQNCVRCHNTDKTRGGLDLSSRATALSGGATSADALVPSDPARSLLLARARDGSMPPSKDGRRLTTEDLQVLSRWIEDGAPWPEGKTLPLRAPTISHGDASRVAPRRRWFWRHR
jgi:mono/diheme cytochrome c family protein